MADDNVEVLYEPVRGSPRALAASWLGAGLFLLFMGWLLSHLLRSTRSLVVAGVVTAAVLYAQSRWAPGGVRATLRITADRAAKTLSFRYRGGELVLPWAEVESTVAERVTAGDGARKALPPGGNFGPTAPWRPAGRGTLWLNFPASRQRFRTTSCAGKSEPWASPCF